LDSTNPTKNGPQIFKRDDLLQHKYLKLNKKQVVSSHFKKEVVREHIEDINNRAIISMLRLMQVKMNSLTRLEEVDKILSLKLNSKVIPLIITLEVIFMENIYFSGGSRGGRGDYSSNRGRG
jgi:hypothetical protein